MKSVLVTILLAYFCSAFGLAQSTAEPQSTPVVKITGTVTDTAGNPLKGVLVYGSLGPCCPVQRESVKTADDGKFVFSKPTKILGFISENHQPATVVIPSGKTDFSITLQPRDPLQGHSCSKISGTRQIGSSLVRFAVPNKDFDISGGKWDVDYVKYVVKLRGSKSWLAMWFGPTAISTDPDEDMVLSSSQFSQREIDLPSVGAAGMDSRGQLGNGLAWRRTVVAGVGGATYDAVPLAEAKAYDLILDSICLVPQRKN